MSFGKTLYLTAVAFYLKIYIYIYIPRYSIPQGLHFCKLFIVIGTRYTSYGTQYQQDCIFCKLYHIFLAADDDADTADADDAAAAAATLQILSRGLSRTLAREWSWRRPSWTRCALCIFRGSLCTVFRSYMYFFVLFFVYIRGFSCAVSSGAIFFSSVHGLFFYVVASYLFCFSFCSLKIYTYVAFCCCCCIVLRTERRRPLQGNAFPLVCYIYQEYSTAVRNLFSWQL